MLGPPAAIAALPESLPADPGRGAQRPTANWTIPDIVEVTRIAGVAIRNGDRIAAFILKQPSIDSGGDRYGLYVMSADRPGTARRLLEAAYLADVQQRPGSATWTFRGDLGQGVQLYAIDDTGRVEVLVMNPEPASVGGADGLVFSSDEGARLTGVIGYGWAPDGSALWYSRLRLASAAERQASEDGGVVFDDATMWRGIDTRAEPAARAIELRLFSPALAEDRLLASAPGNRQTAQFAFQAGSVAWVDPRQLAYRLITVAGDGRRSASRRIVDVSTGQAREAGGRSFLDAFSAAPTPDGDLVVRRETGGRRLVAVAEDGAISRNYGRVAFSSLGGSLGYWRDPGAGRSIAGVRFPDRDGLMMFPSPTGAPLERITDHLSDCAFVADLSLGVCNRESLTRAPELVAVDPATGALTVLARPNARYSRIRPLRTVPARWTNRFGAMNEGYVTYPRNYRPGGRHPAIVITHASDARNRFAYHGFQWEYPAQVFAERGYFVLSVNEPEKDPAAVDAYATGSADVPAATMQHEWGFNVVASMEAAVQSLIDQGLVDPARIGIAGFSRGASVTTMTLSQSRLFRAGAAGDANWFAAGGYWDNAVARGIYNGLFGGSPLDPQAFPNYLAFSPSARAEHFAGPLLQQFTAATADLAIELDAALRIANVPTELVFYRDETHLLHQPRRRASAMQFSLDWFDYWLLDRRESGSANLRRYQRWDAMAARWRR